MFYLVESVEQEMVLYIWYVFFVAVYKFASMCLGLQELTRIMQFQMHTEVQLLSPLVPVRQVRILRFCKQHAEGVWAVVDVSVEIGHDPSNAQPFISCRRLPSGCIVQDMPNGYSKVSANTSFFFISFFYLAFFVL
jgi:hypothetical protein